MITQNQLYFKLVITVMRLFIFILIIHVPKPDDSITVLEAEELLLNPQSREIVHTSNKQV